MTNETAETLARSVARILRQAVEKEGDISDPGSWVVAARKLGARVHKFRDTRQDAPIGFFVADSTGGAIYYNSSASTQIVCRRICHELAHFLLAQWTGSGLRRRQPEMYDDRRDTVQHRAARMVEELLLP